MGQNWKKKLPCGGLRVELPGAGGTPAFSRPMGKEGTHCSRRQGELGLREDLDCCEKTRGSTSELVRLPKTVCHPQRPCVWVEDSGWNSEEGGQGHPGNRYMLVWTHRGGWEEEGPRKLGPRWAQRVTQGRVRVIFKGVQGWNTAEQRWSLAGPMERSSGRKGTCH